MVNAGGLLKLADMSREFIAVVALEYSTPQAIKASLLGPPLPRQQIADLSRLRKSLAERMQRDRTPNAQYYLHCPRPDPRFQDMLIP